MKIHREKRIHIRRGRILRVNPSGNGLLMVEGQQHAFRPDETWQSKTPPAPGQVVNVEFDSTGNVTGVAAVASSQVSNELISPSLSILQTSTGIKRVSPPAIAAVVMLAAWFFSTAISIQTPVAGNLELTAWDIFGLLNRGDATLSGQQNSAGWYGIAALVALAGALLPVVWKNRMAPLGGLLPLLFLMIVALIFRSRLETAIAADAKTISLGPGAYLSGALGLYLAFIAARRFLIFNSPRGEAKQPPAHEKTA